MQTVNSQIRIQSSRTYKSLSTLVVTAFMGMGAVAFLVFFLTVKQPVVQSAGAIRYVAPSGVNTGDCTNSGNPCSTIQYALDQAGIGEEIRVAGGMYSGVSARAGVTQSVYISKSATIRGGYPTDFSTLPDPIANPTTLDAQNLGRVFFITENSIVNIEGFNITNGNGYAGGAPQDLRVDGGGLYVVTATVTLTNNNLMSNTADSGGGLATFGSGNDLTMFGNTVAFNYGENFGGGLHVGGSATLNNNLIISNTTPRDGAGIYYSAGNGTLINNTIMSNTAANRGGGMYMGGGPILVQDNLFKNNTAECSASMSFPGGGGLYLRTATGIVVDNVIIENSTGCWGGGIRSESSSALINNNIILSNTADVSGGGLNFLLSNSNGEAIADGNTIMFNSSPRGGGVSIINARATLINNFVTQNQVITKGAGIEISLSYATILHSTIARNTGGEGSGITASYAFVTMTNSIIVSHSVGISLGTEASVTLEATLWGSDEWANGVDWTGISTPTTSLDIYGHPMFVDPDGRDYHITTASAAYDAGVDAGVDHDIDDDPRPLVGTFDIGADEVPPSLILGKSAPALVAAGDFITYTLTVLNNLPVMVTDVVLTDTIPANATYISGGTQVGNVVSWTLPSLSSGSSFTRSFIVTATQTITNDDYRVSSSGGFSATGNVPVVTVVVEPITGLVATNDSPTILGSPTSLFATIASGSDVSYVWAFGDGTNGNGPNVTHTYPNVGQHTAVVTASNLSGSVVASTVVTIETDTWAVYMPITLKAAGSVNQTNQPISMSQKILDIFNQYRVANLLPLLSFQLMRSSSE